MAADATTDATAAAEDTEAEEQKETDERREALLSELSSALGDSVLATHVDPGRDVWARVAIDVWAEAAEVVRHRMGARYFGFLSVIDWMPSPFGRSMDSEVDKALGTDGDSGTDETDEPAEMHHGVTGGESRFQVFARVAKVGDPEDHWGITLVSDIPESLEVPTWTNTYAGADWHEREAWEMYGVTFTGHPGLRHIYLPGDFEGNPLRKDFPLIARMVKPWPGIVDVEALPEVEPAADPGTDTPDGSGTADDGGGS